MARELPLDHLRPVSLADLMSVAELQTRIDRKYLVERAAVSALLTDQRLELGVLEIGDLRRFAYESVYFDTPGLTSFLGSARSRRHRFKVRTRTYLDSQQCMLEVKTRQGESTVKRRIDYPFAERHRLTPDGLAYVGADDGVRADPDDLAPVLVTHYDRTTLLHERSGTRLTCDTGLRLQASGGLTGEPGGDVVVVEVKSPSGVSPVDKLLWRAGYRPAAISKYGTGMAALHPNLPANKWNRTLRRHFGWHPVESPITTPAAAPVAPLSSRTQDITDAAYSVNAR